MWIAIGILIFLIAFFTAYICLIKPNTKRGKALRPFEERYIAHRGLFDNNTGCPENSIASFQKAIDMGYCIELDVQITADGRLVVFHDDTLLRMCGVNRYVRDCTYEELSSYPLAKTEERIPLFEDVLSFIDGRAPIVIEIKTSDMWLEATRMTSRILDVYKGCYCVESFNPMIISWFRKNRPEVIRGQLASDFFKDDIKMSFIRRLLLSNLMLNFKAKPDFIAYNHLRKSQPSYRLIRRLFNVKNVAWTVRSESELTEAKRVFDCIIFDSFIPGK